MPANPFNEHRKVTRRLAKSLNWADVYHWLVQFGYYPESYVLPPCFKVVKRPKNPRQFYKIVGKQTKKRFSPKLMPELCCGVHFPKSELTDRSFGVIHPEIHNDIAYHIARNWKTIVDALLPADSDVTCYSFPLPVDVKHPGRVGHLRSGRMIYEFLWMTEEDVASVAYGYSHILRADIRSFYPSIYTHSISWVLHGKKLIRKGQNRWDLNFLGNRLDKLFQHGNDQKTNGIPIGPSVSDIVSEMIAAGVDRELTKGVNARGLDCVMVRFKDDYRILVKSETDGHQIVGLLQSALKEYELLLADEKTSISRLPGGLFRGWVSAYHAAYPRKRAILTWKEFRELYLAVLRIDAEFSGTGVIDRFLADIVSDTNKLTVVVTTRNLRKAMSMLLMLGNRRVKSFPKVLAIIESILHSPFGQAHATEITEYLGQFLLQLARDESRNVYLITWIAYFLVSNNLKGKLAYTPKLTDPIARSVLSNQGLIFKKAANFKLFQGCVTASKAHSMLEHLDVFNPPDPT